MDFVLSFHGSFHLLAIWVRQIVISNYLFIYLFVVNDAVSTSY
jgi:hypothetical protein